MPEEKARSYSDDGTQWYTLVCTPCGSTSFNFGTCLATGEMRAGCTKCPNVILISMKNLMKFEVRKD